MNLSGDAQYPRYPHLIIRETPAYALKYTNTKKYAPAVSYTDIDESTGALSGQADFYDEDAWTARDDAPFMVSEKHHPTQIWLGLADMPIGTKVRDAADPASICSFHITPHMLGGIPGTLHYIPTANWLQPIIRIMVKVGGA